MSRRIYPHGSHARYTAACECDLCRKGTRTWRRAYRRGVYLPTIADLSTLPDDYLTTPAEPCGTPAARQRHLRHGEPVCDECRDAYNAYQRTMRARRRQQHVTAGART